MAGSLGTMLETQQLEDWKRDRRLSGWKIGDDARDLAARSLGTSLET